MDNVLIKFDADSTGLAPGIDGLVQLEVMDKQVAEQAKKTTAAIAEKNKGIVDGTGVVKKSMADLLTSVSNADKGIVGMSYKKVLGDMRTELNLTNAQAQKFYQNIIANSKLSIVNNKNKEEVANLVQLLDAASEALKKMGVGEEGVEQKTIKATTQLRAMKQELLQLEDNGIGFSKTYGLSFDQLSAKAAKLEDQIGDNSQRIRDMSKDTFAFDAILSGLTGVAAGFSVAQGAAALFGSENEDVQKALLKVQAALAILNGLQQIYALVVDQSTAKTGVAVLMQKLFGTQSAATAVALEGETVAAGEAAIATEGFTAALAANPATVLLVAIVALGAALFAFTGDSDKAAESAKATGEEIESMGDAMNHSGEAFAKATTDVLNMKIAVDSAKQGFIDKDRVVNMYNETLGKTLGTAKNFNEVEDIMSDEKRLNAYIRVMALKAAANYAMEQAAKSLFEAEKANALNQNIDSAKNTGGVFNDKQFKTISEGFKTINQKTADAATTQAKTVEQVIKDIFSQINTISQGAGLDPLGGEFQSKLDKNIKVTEKKVATLQDLLRGGGKFNEDSITAPTDSSQDAIVKSMVASVDKFYAQLKLSNLREKDDALATLEDQFNQGTLKLQDYNIQRAEINKQYSLRDINNSIVATEAKIENLSYLGQSTADEEERLFQLKEQYRQADLESFKEIEAAKVKANEDAAKKRGETEQFLINTTSKIYGVFYNNEKSRLQNQAGLDQDLYNKKLITQDEYNKRQEKLKKQEAAANKEKAIVDIVIDGAKKFFEIKSQAAVLLANPVTAPLAASALAQIPQLLVQEGIALAFVAAQKFKTGKIQISGPGTETSDSIPAFLSNNESVINAQATRKYKPALQAINEFRFEEYLESIQVPRMAHMNMSEPRVPRSRATKIISNIDYEKIGESFAKHVGKFNDLDIPGMEFHIDEKGIHAIVKRNNEETEFQNKRYSTK